MPAEGESGVETAVIRDFLAEASAENVKRRETGTPYVVVAHGSILRLRPERGLRFHLQERRRLVAPS